MTARIPTDTSPISDYLWPNEHFNFTQGPIVALGNDSSDPRPTTLLCMDNNRILWISNLRENAPPLEIKFSDLRDEFEANDIAIDSEQLNTLLSKIMGTCLGIKLAWFRLSPKRPSEHVGRNLYLDRISENIAHRLQINHPVMIQKISTSQDDIARRTFQRLSEVIKLSHYLTDTSDVISWKLLLESNVDFHGFDPNGVIGTIFKRNTLKIVETGTVEIYSSKIAVDNLYDIYCEIKSESKLKRRFEHAINQWLGIPDTDGDRRFYWREFNVSYDTFIRDIKSTFTQISYDINPENIQKVYSSLNAIPVVRLRIASTSILTAYSSALFKLNEWVLKIAAFVEWYPELFSHRQSLDREIAACKNKIESQQHLTDSLIAAQRHQSNPFELQRNIITKLDALRHIIQTSNHDDTSIHWDRILEKIDSSLIETGAKV